MSTVFREFTESELADLLEALDVAHKYVTDENKKERFMKLSKFLIDGS